MSRPISDAWFHRVKSATRDLVQACGGLVRTGELAHASKSEVSRWQVATDEAIIPLPAVLALEADCGLPLVTTVMADLGGRRLEGSADDTVSATSVLGHYAETMRASSELMASTAAALADGKITGAELEILDRNAGALERASATLRLNIAQAKGGPALKVVGQGE
ncbi:hypothetical protein [Kaistia nematophila]|uniref:Uncharacterized protein n=1 Tax=Kaistia nematophila TaxID=2994654 RepID=A0A9X3IM69_9HYPH|nr:hypothetical protein [Kaistia nematophila]MCX5571459.1 hypothetical protein [Kaistia nematophila]